jgi:hypothetical protein
VKIFHQIASFLLACLLLISTTGFSMYKHYCGDNLKEISLFDEIESCHDIDLIQEVKDECPYHKHETAAVGEEDDCCKDEYNRISLEDQLKQLDKNQNKNLALTAIVTDLGHQSQMPEFDAENSQSLYLEGAPINAPPLYILYTQFNFYG